MKHTKTFDCIAFTISIGYSCVSMHAPCEFFKHVPKHCSIFAIIYKKRNLLVYVYLEKLINAHWHGWYVLIVKVLVHDTLVVNSVLLFCKLCCFLYLVCLYVCFCLYMSCPPLRPARKRHSQAPPKVCIQERNRSHHDALSVGCTTGHPTSLDSALQWSAAGADISEV